MATEPMKLYNCIFDPPLPDDPVERANRLKELGMTELPPATDPQAQTLAPLLTMSEEEFNPPPLRKRAEGEPEDIYLIYRAAFWFNYADALKEEAFALRDSRLRLVGPTCWADEPSRSELMAPEITEFPDPQPMGIRMWPRHRLRISTDGEQFRVERKVWWWWVDEDGPYDSLVSAAKALERRVADPFWSMRRQWTPVDSSRIAHALDPVRVPPAPDPANDSGRKTRDI